MTALKNRGYDIRYKSQYNVGQDNFLSNWRLWQAKKKRSYNCLENGSEKISFASPRGSKVLGSDENSYQFPVAHTHKHDQKTSYQTTLACLLAWCVRCRLHSVSSTAAAARKRQRRGAAWKAAATAQLALAYCVKLRTQLVSGWFFLFDHSANHTMKLQCSEACKLILSLAFTCVSNKIVG